MAQWKTNKKTNKPFRTSGKNSLKKRGATHSSGTRLKRRTNSYNGWPNKETWSINMFLSNDYDTYHQLIQTLRKGATKDEFIDILKSYAKTNNGDNVDLDKVKWNRLYSSWKDNLRNEGY